MSRSSSNARTEQETREDTAAFLASYRARGGFAGALARQAGQPTVARQHMPFPGHRHMGETS